MGRWRDLAEQLEREDAVRKRLAWLDALPDMQPAPAKRADRKQLAGRYFAVLCGHRGVAQCAGNDQEGGEHAA